MWEIPIKAPAGTLIIYEYAFEITYPDLHHSQHLKDYLFPFVFNADHSGVKNTEEIMPWASDRLVDIFLGECEGVACKTWFRGLCIIKIVFGRLSAFWLVKIGVE